MKHDELLETINLVPLEGLHAWTQRALYAVVELHKPVLWQKIEMVCDGCGMDIEQNYNSAYPCETIQAIEEKLQ